MSQEPNLTCEQAEIESLLRRLAPVDSTLDRDALMYQAGWDAAARSPSKTHWLWPATSAALAATLLFAITLPTNNPQPASLLQQTGTSAPPQKTPIAEQTVQLEKPNSVHAAFMPLNRYAPQASLLVMRDRALRFDFDSFSPDEPPSDLPVATETTNRQLLQEFLPNSNRPNSKKPSSRPRRFWPSWNLGETS